MFVSLESRKALPRFRLPESTGGTDDLRLRRLERVRPTHRSHR
jgi:hypothetical protein